MLMFCVCPLLILQTLIWRRVTRLRTPRNGIVFIDTAELLCRRIQRDNAGESVILFRHEDFTKHVIDFIAPIVGSGRRGESTLYETV